jgi:hypothetical protein
VVHAQGVGALLFRLKYWVYLRPIFHGQFNDQDTWMVRLMRTPPERLYRPDVSIIAWRKLAELSRGARLSGTAADGATRETTEHEVPESTPV